MLTSASGFRVGACDLNSGLGLGEQALYCLSSLSRQVSIFFVKLCFVSFAACLLISPIPPFFPPAPKKHKIKLRQKKEEGENLVLEAAVWYSELRSKSLYNNHWSDSRPLVSWNWVIGTELSLGFFLDIPLLPCVVEFLQPGSTGLMTPPHPSSSAPADHIWGGYWGRQHKNPGSGPG